MKIIEPSAVLMKDFDGAEIVKFLERCGRTAYQSQKNITETSAENFIRNIIKRGHESVLEHFSCTFKIICDRGVMAELTRHRHASFTIESTRFCDYSKDELTFIKPCFWKNRSTNEYLYEYDTMYRIYWENRSTNEYLYWYDTMYRIESDYKKLREQGATPEQARAILPNSLKTEIVMTANLRELRTILKLRCDKKAHPQMRQLALMILKILYQKLPIVFEDIWENYKDECN